MARHRRRARVAWGWAMTGGRTPLLVLVVPVGQRGCRTIPEDGEVDGALREIEALIADKPGDPGASVHLAARVEAVLRQADKGAPLCRWCST